MNKSILFIFLYILGMSIATISVCSLGAYCMYITEGETGIGWSILGLLIIWGNGISFKAEEENKP